MNGITAEADTLTGADRNPVKRDAPELDRNANAFVHVSGLIDELRGQVNDNVPASIHYELDVFW